MIYVTPKQAELLSYLTGRQPVGAFFTAPRAEMAHDLGWTEYSICQQLRYLESKGCVERQSHFIRVLKRLEDDDVTEGMPPKEPKYKSKTPRRRLIKYAGYDEYEARNW